MLHDSKHELFREACHLGVHGLLGEAVMERLAWILGVAFQLEEDLEGQLTRLVPASHAAPGG